ncbi:hypothetical protein AB0B25_30490 [Nocardia sp. NPDC049190]|uniref:hypothetical protein n=1 Tax=Nocardia sp. NPDC049190 TaxID=3155650 RepID=UPI0033C92EF3
MIDEQKKATNCAGVMSGDPSTLTSSTVAVWNRRSLYEAIDTTTPGRRPVLHIFTVPGEFIRQLIVQGRREGLAAAGSASAGHWP